ncbi:MAG: hypothetical protein DID92_2727745027 [Candidatus Nitrotoga sp. SPKER]|nr:MAG: hypothetical protein DID92_2727745027 [Candidatus Nitrotoga sp. SPKER]
MGKMKELENKLKKLEKVKPMNTLPTGKTTFITWIAIGCLYSGQGTEK